MHIVYFYIRLYSFYGPCGPEIKLYYYYYYYYYGILAWGHQSNRLFKLQKRIGPTTNNNMQPVYLPYCTVVKKTGHIEVK